MRSLPDSVRLGSSAGNPDDCLRTEPYQETDAGGDSEKYAVIVKVFRPGLASYGLRSCRLGPGRLQLSRNPVEALLQPDASLIERADLSPRG